MKVSWFSLQGFIDYLPLGFKTKNELGGDVTTPFDLFSFGAESEKTTDKTTGKGLYFSDLGLEMNYTIAHPTNKTFGFKANEITFDRGRSTPRNLSLFTNFALDEATLLQGTKDNTHDKLGFLNLKENKRKRKL